MPGPERLPRLGELEAEIMKRVWARGTPLTVRDMVTELEPSRPLAYTTVMTVMDNLHRKGWLRRQRAGRAYRYEPVIAGEEYSAALMRQALGVGSDRVAAFTHFLQDMPEEEVDALLDAYRRLTDGPGPER
jgi:predicted transcriptional regulator